MKSYLCRKKTITIVISMLFVILITTSCWNRRELDTLGIVIGTALDKGQEPFKIQITAQLIKVSNIQTSSDGGTNSAKQYWNLKEQGTSIFETIRKMTLTSSRKLYWPQNQIIIFSKELAQEGIAPYIDFFLRDQETRLLTLACVSDKKAESLLNTQAELENLPAMEIENLLENYGSSSLVPRVNLKEFTERLTSKNTSGYLPLIGMKKIDNKDYINLLGTAVFDEDRYVGNLDRYETRGLLWVLGKVKSGIITVDCPGVEGSIGLEIFKAKSKVTPEVKDGKLQILIKIREEGGLADQECPLNLTELSKWHVLIEKQNQAIKKEILSALAKAQEYNTDIFGFGESIHRKYPSLWKELEGQWKDIFPQLKIIVEVDSILTGSGKITKPVFER